MSTKKKRPKKRYEKPCNCGLCNPQPGKRYHPKWGFDLDKVKKTCCLNCKKPIGESEYKLIDGLARFGTMQFAHAGKCADRMGANESQRKEKKNAKQN